MEKEFIPHKLALELKELGYDEPNYFLKWYDSKGKIREGLGLGEVKAPLYQQAFRWFREKYGLVVAPQYFTGGFYCFTINNMKDTSKSNRLFTEFETYEEAELACLKKLIEIVKNK